MTTIDVMYLAWNRREFTEKSFGTLLATTDWDLVRRLVVFDDGSEDGTWELLVDLAKRCPAETVLHRDKRCSPPSYMNLYVAEYGDGADRVGKIDNDVMAPHGWLTDLAGVMDREPEIELLGMEAGRLGYPGRNGEPWDGVYRFEPGTHIGGVGLMSVDAFRSRPPMAEHGRFGFTEWQHEHQPVRGWIRPDLLVCTLDLIPLPPWDALSDYYIEQGWQRRWSRYDPFWGRYYWEWWMNDDEEADPCI